MNIGLCCVEINVTALPYRKKRNKLTFTFKKYELNTRNYPLASAIIQAHISATVQKQVFSEGNSPPIVR
jgi:hypothetical protein